MLFKRKPDQSQSISGANITGAQVQQGQAGRDLTQTQQGNQAEVQSQGMTVDEVVALLSQVEAMVRAAQMPEASKTKAIAYLGAAQQEATEPEPDKELMAKNLKRMGDTLTTANETVTAGKTLWQTVKPILLPLASWLGVAASFIP